MNNTWWNSSVKINRRTLFFVWREFFCTQLILCDVRQHLVRPCGLSICTVSHQDQNQYHLFLHVRNFRHRFLSEKHHREDQCSKSASSLTSWENTFPVTLLATMWELFVKTLYRTGQWYFPGTKWSKEKKVREQQAEQQSPICCQGLNPLKKSTSTSCNPLLNYITSSPLTCFFGFLFLQPPLSQAFFFKVPLTQSKAVRKARI